MSHAAAIRAILRDTGAPTTLRAIQMKLAIENHLVALDILQADLDQLVQDGKLTREDLPGNRITYCTVDRPAFLPATPRLAPAARLLAASVNKTLAPADRILAALAQGPLRSSHICAVAHVCNATCERHLKLLINGGQIERKAWLYSLTQTKGAADAAVNGRLRRIADKKQGRLR